jgi:hypothetical protein
MRAIKLAPALCVLAACSLAPAGVAAARVRTPQVPGSPSRRSGGCKLDLNVVSSPIESGEPVTVNGDLSCGGDTAEQSGQAVTLLQHVNGVPGDRAVGTTTTTSSGEYTLETAAGAIAANSRLYVSAAGARSPLRSVKVYVKVTLNAPAGKPEGSTIETGHANQVIFSGTVAPSDRGARVVLQRQASLNGDEWRRVAVSSVSANGEFSISHTFHVPGDAEIRALVTSVKGAQERFIPSGSNELAYDISQREDPSLTIESSSDPITSGASTTIEGVIAGAPAGTPVALDSRTRGTSAFTTVASTTTGAGGKYVFDTLSPVNSTFYRAVGDGRKSSLLFEGVKYALTTQVSGVTVTAGRMTVEEGQPVTFSGALTPGVDNHRVVLQAEDVASGAHAGSDFHFATEAGTTAAGTFEMVHAIYRLGTNVFRIRVPGDPGNGPANSQLLTIEVTPATQPLRLPGPGNAPLSSEGQT